MLKKCDHLSGCCPLEAVCRQPFDNVTTIYNVDDDLQERVNLPCISPGQAVWFLRRVLMNVWLGMMVMKHLSQVSSQDPGWELSSDWTASERAITACSVHSAHITESKTGSSTTASWLQTRQNNTTATAILSCLMSIFFGIVCSVFVLGPLCCLRQCFLLIVYVKCHFTIALCKQN